jgi:hypothetical protein
LRELDGKDMGMSVQFDGYLIICEERVKVPLHISNSQTFCKHAAASIASFWPTFILFWTDSHSFLSNTKFLTPPFIIVSGLQLAMYSHPRRLINFVALLEYWDPEFTISRF